MLLMNHRIQNISKNLKTQDNRITADPIFIVEQLKKDFGYDSDYATDWVWVDTNDSEYGEITDPKAIETLNKIDEIARNWGETPKAITNDDQTLKYDSARFQKVYYKERWEFVQPFFTEEGANNYIEVDGHNLGKTRTYVISGYRNFEMQDIRKLLMKEENE